MSNVFRLLQWKVKGELILKDKPTHKDPRFRIAKREAWIGIGLVLFNFIWWYGFAYGLGSGNPEDYQFIFGFPAWFFYSCIGSLVIMSLLVFFVVTRFFKDVPFEDEETN